MPRLTTGQKSQRALQFMLGVRNRRARRALAAHGFREEDFDDGWDRLKAITKSRLNDEPVEIDPTLVRDLDEWENRWFPIVDAVLRNNYPAVHKRVFLNLRQTEGAEVIFSVSTLLDRLEEIALPADEGGSADGRAARKLLERRGLTDDIVGSARELLAQIGTLEADDEEADIELDQQEREAAEKRLWSWYLEWSAIARVAIRDRRMLRALGFLRTVKRADGTEEDVVVDDEDVDTDAPAPVPTPTPAPFDPDPDV